MLDNIGGRGERLGFITLLRRETCLNVSKITYYILI